MIAPVPNEINELKRKLNIINGSIKIKMDLISRLIDKLNDFNSIGITSPTSSGRKSTDKIISGNLIRVKIPIFNSTPALYVPNPSIPLFYAIQSFFFNTLAALQDNDFHNH